MACAVCFCRKLLSGPIYRIPGNIAPFEVVKGEKMNGFQLERCFRQGPLTALENVSDPPRSVESTSRDPENVPNPTVECREKDVIKYYNANIPRYILLIYGY